MPEKTLNAVPRAVREQYDKGVTALQRQNFDYAISILTGIVNAEPGFYECRQALRAAQFKKMGGSTGFFKKMIGAGTSSPLQAKGQMALRKNPLEAIQIAEQILAGDPNSGAGHRLLVDAAQSADLPMTAILSQEILWKNSPKDRALGLELAHAYAEAGLVDKAEQLYQDLLKAFPSDPEIGQAMKNVSARRTMSEGGYDSIADGKGSYRDLLKNKEEAVMLEQESRQVKTGDTADRLIQDYTDKLQAEPNNLKLWRSLAELYAQCKHFDHALYCYNQIVALEGAVDPSLEKIIMELSLKKIDAALAALDPAIPEQAEQIAKMQAERAEFTLKEVKKRAEKYPNDLQIAFELGQLYFLSGKVNEAIQEFQRAQGHPQRRLASMTFLGQCFAKRGMNDLAARTLQNALKEKVGMDEEKKDLIYALSSVLEKMGKADEAIEHYKQIYEIDIGYRDVAAKIDAYYASKA